MRALIYRVFGHRLYVGCTMHRPFHMAVYRWLGKGH